MRFRGIGLVPSVTLSDVEALVAAGCKYARYWLAPYETHEPDEWWEQVRTHASHLKGILAAVPELHVIVDMHYPSPTGVTSDTVAAWNHVVEELRGIPNLLGYGLINEPSGSHSAVRAFQAALLEEVEFERKKICVTPPRSDPEQFSGRFRAYAGYQLPIWYEVHMYLPFRVSHQGVYPRYPIGAVYPDPASGLNKQTLRRLLKKTRDFQLRTRAHIFVGEFAISSFADSESRYRYTQDCIDIFEEYGWHWSAFVWRDAGAPWDMENSLIFEYIRRHWALCE